MIEGIQIKQRQPQREFRIKINIQPQSLAGRIQQDADIQQAFSPEIKANKSVFEPIDDKEFAIHTRSLDVIRAIQKPPVIPEPAPIDTRFKEQDTYNQRIRDVINQQKRRRQFEFGTIKNKKIKPKQKSSIGIYSGWGTGQQ